MEIRELKADELDYAVLPCVDSGFRKTLKQGMDLRKKFLKKMKRQGIVLLVAFENLGMEKRIDYPGVGQVKVKDLSKNGKVPIGLIEYVPIEKTIFPVTGKDIAFVHCIWVIPPFWRKGVARALMENFLTRTSHLSGGAVIAYEKESWWGFFDYMPKWFFSKFGFKEVEKKGKAVLMFRNSGRAQPPEFISSQPGPDIQQKKTKVDYFWSTQCPYSWWVGKLLDKKFGKSSKFELKLINTDKRKIVQKIGLTFGMKMNGKTIFDRMPSWDEVNQSLKSI